MHKIPATYCSVNTSISFIKGYETWQHPPPEYIINFVLKAINRLSPAYFHNYFTPSSSVHRFGTRQATRGDLLNTLKNTTLYRLQTAQYFGSKLWNTLPIFIRVTATVALLRSKLEAYFIDSYVYSVTFNLHSLELSFWGLSCYVFFVFYLSFLIFFVF